MRLLLLPISTRRTLIYCEPISSTLDASKQSYLERAVAYANKTWSTWEKAEGGWKLKTTQWGNQLFRRIPYEEWALKSIPPLGSKSAGGKRKDGSSPMISIRFPPEFQALSKTSVLDTLRELSTSRQALHKRRMVWSLVGLPITAPLGLLPVLPNIPFFYLAFRAYSHWRALSGSRHLEHLINADRLTESPMGVLDSLYAAGLLHPSRASSRNAPDPSAEQSKRVASLVRQQMAGGEIIAPQASLSSSDGESEKSSSPSNKAPKDSSSSSSPSSQDLPDAEEILLLQGWNGKLIAERLELPSLEVEIERAVEQVEKALASKGAGELQKEKRELERVREAHLARQKTPGATSDSQQQEKAVK